MERNLKFVLCLLFFVSLCHFGQGIKGKNKQMNYAQYPVWDACINASMSFDFKTRGGNANSMLMYMDDRGVSDFIQVELDKDAVILTMKVSNNPDIAKRVKVSGNYNNNRWHRVTITRNRMEVRLTVDGVTYMTFLEGEDFHLGNLTLGNSYLFFGGIPEHFYNQNLRDLSNPQITEAGNFQGNIRNVIYRNCTCFPTRAEMITGHGIVEKSEEDKCNLADNKCTPGCVCIRTDTGTGCDCSYIEQCKYGAQNDIVYYLPMDAYKNRTLENPSGLYATVSSQPVFIRGVLDKALVIRGHQSIQVAGPAHRQECFGDLDLCPEGYTISFWIKFVNPSYKRQVYLTNGGHRSDSHGIAMFYYKGVLEFIFRDKSGHEWRAMDRNVLPNHWYYIAASWSKKHGLDLVKNGILSKRARRPTVGKPATKKGMKYSDFIIGTTNDDPSAANQGVIIMDEFKFWDRFMTVHELKQLGPIYHYHLDMNVKRGKSLDVPHMDASITGNVWLSTDAVFGRSLHISGPNQYVSLQHQGQSCLGNLERCLYGFMMSMWIKFVKLDGKRYYVSTGLKGLTIYSNENTLYADATSKEKVWQVSMERLETGIWYFLEVSFNKNSGLSMYLNQRFKEHQSLYSFRSSTKTKHGNMYIGRGNIHMKPENYPNVYIDDMNIYFADRDTLIYLEFIQRGRPSSHYFTFDQMMGNRIIDQSILIETYGQPKLVPGKIGSAIQLDGNTEYVDLNEHPGKCLGDLDACQNGFLMSGWIRLDHLKDNMEFFSTALNGITMDFVGGKIVFSLSTSARMWTAQVHPRSLSPGHWQFLELSWHPERGMNIYANGNLIASDHSRGTGAVKNQNYHYQASEDRFYLGKGKDINNKMVFGAVTFDNIRYWYGDRDYLLAHGYIHRGRPMNYLIDMEKINGRRLLDDSLYITVNGDPKLIPGRVGYAINLNESNQYINLGNHINSCLGNLEKCTNGILVSSWMKFGPYRNNMYYYSTGKGGISMYQRQGYMYVNFMSGSKKWKIQIPSLKQDEWNFVELSWHPDTGLDMYVNNKLVGHSDSLSYKEDPPQGKEFLIGRPNHGESKGSASAPNFAIDELEIWYGTRENLLASNYIVRDNNGQETFSMETNNNGIVANPHFTVRLVNGASLTDGYIGNGILLNGIDQHVHIEPNGEDCIYDLDKCTNGLTTSVWLNPRDLKGTKYFLSSPAYSLYTENDELRAKFHNGTRSWSVGTHDFKTDKWQHVVLSWDPYRGLTMYVDKIKVDSTGTSEPYLPSDDPNPGEGIYIGTDLSTQERYHANVTVDELKYYRTSVNGITKGYGPFLSAEVPEKFFRFDRLLIPGVVFYGSPDLSVGGYGKVLHLNGINQYGTLGTNITCGGDLENCVDGFVARVTIKPDELRDNMYIIDSYPMSIYYLEGRLYGKLRTATETWEVSTDKFSAGKWQNIELDWYPDIGLRMFINREVVAQDNDPKTHQWQSTESETILGRSLDGSADDRFLNGMVERIELWRRRRTDQISTNVVPTDVPPTNKFLTLSGNSFYGFNLSAFKPDYLVRSSNETFKFIFRNDPSQKEGLLWYASNPERTVFLILKEGNIYFVSESSDGRIEKIPMNKPSSIRFDDSTDHEVVLRREGTKIYWVVDDIYKKEFRVPNSVSFLDNRDYVYVGGTPDNEALTQGETKKNFKGIIHRVEYDTIRSHLDLISMSPSTDPTSISITPRPTVSPQTPRPTRPPTPRPTPESFSPITFTTSESYVRTHTWDIRSRGGEIKFKFLTNDPHGLLLFNGDAKYFIALELFDGDLYIVYNFGSGPKRVKFANEVLIDGKPHDVQVSIDPLHSFLELQVDKFKKKVDLSKDDTFVNSFSGDMYVGWVDSHIEKRLPWALLSSKGFRGCLIEFEMNRRQDVLRPDSGSKYGIKQQCQPIRHQCNSNTCKNGLCRDYWNSYICDCSNTPYTGPNCDIEAPTAVFDGIKYAYITYEETQASHIDDISLRFQTPLRNATLFRTTGKNTSDTMEVSLVNGEVVLVITVNGATRRLRTGKNLNDKNWHTLYVRRRANQISMWVDDGDAVSKTMKVKNFTFNVNKVDIGAKNLSGKPQHNFIGYMQNFHYNNLDIFTKLKSEPNPALVFKYGETLPIWIYHDMTFPTQESYVEMPTLEAPATLELDLMFKTKESSGVLIYNGGSNNEFIALELQDGRLAMVYNMGSLPTSIYFQTPSKLNDNKWHYVNIHRMTPQRWSMKVDNSKVVSTQDKFETLDIDGPLYIGGAPKHILMKGEVTKLRSTHGFQGCIASVNLNGNIADIHGPTARRHNVLNGCQNISMLCKKTTCANNGICIQKKNGFMCDCSETTYMGTRCTEQTIGYYFGSQKLDGVIIYTYPHDQRLDSAEETISFGFMTNVKDGTITRVTSSVNNDFIEIGLKDGKVVATYDTGSNTHILTSVGNYSDGAYHTVKFHRDMSQSSLIVDGQAAVNSTHEDQIRSYFDKLTTIAIGASERTSTNDYINPFHGIIAGYYINNLRPFDNTGRGNNIGVPSGDTKIAIRPFTLGESFEPKETDFTTPEPTTPAPTVAPIPVETTPDITGITIVPGEGGGRGGGGGDRSAILVETDDDGGLGVAVDVPNFAPIRSGAALGGVSDSGGAGGIAAAFVSGGAGGAVGGAGGSAGAAGAAGAGSRAGAAAGTFLALLTLGAGLTWAFVQCKPGMCSGFGGGGSGGASITSPEAITPLIQQSAGGGGGGAGAGAGAGGAGQAKVQVVNGSAAGGGGSSAGGGGGSSSGFTFINTGSSSAYGSGQAGDSATLRVTGTFSNKGTAIGTPRQGRAATAQSSGYSSQQNTLQVQSASSAGSGFTYMDGSSAVASGYGGGVTNYDRSGSSNYNYDSATYMSGGGGTMGGASTVVAGGPAGAVSQQQFDNTMYSSLGVDGRSNMQQDVFSQNTLEAAGYSSSTNTLASSYNYQMKSYTARNESSSSYMSNYNTSTLGGTQATLPGQVVIADGVRVDCCLMTSDGHSVVTGSSTGSPQVWDMQSGELLRSMQGNILGASNLHLAYNGQLLVGSVNMDNLGVNEFSTKKGVTNRSLQIWDFDSGRPLEMPGEEYCSALQVMSDGDKVALGRTDKFGNSTSIIVWDLLGNQPIKEMRYEASVGNNDYISFLNLSQNNRYAVAGFQNTLDGGAEFVVFDMTLTSYNVVEPSILKMNANPECTAILKDEAVTGLKNGDLVVWNLRNGQPLRQMLSSSGNHAHNAEVTAVALSEDSSTLVSASADSTIKVWDMSNESLVNTLVGHTGVVSCVAISPDNEIIASGSQDGSIRLWRAETGSQFCSFNTNMDVFFVTMSRDKGTIVALGDKFGARKLIMLQVVRSKVRRQVQT